MSGETKNIDEMASIISDAIFKEMKWELNEEYKDINWLCNNIHHNKKTHPTDVVFSYKDPYSAEMQYVQTDLKSYSKASISKVRVTSAIESLATQVECSRDSREWAEKFRRGEIRYGLHGMLFIYNNDEHYDSDLLDTINHVAKKEYKIPLGSTLNILTPRTIRFLMTVVEHIKERRYIDKEDSSNRQLEKIAPRNECGFFYPDKHNRIADTSVSHSATLEMITSGMLLFNYKNPLNGQSVLNIYWDEAITSSKEFIYLFEFVFHYQLLNQFDLVYVITPFCQQAMSYFNQAKRGYENYALTDSQLEKINKIKYLSMPVVKVTLFPFTMQNGESRRHLVQD
ncbi:hypothetical protein FHC51_00570 [Leclercia sp. EC_58]|uniref:hypothetical protein n=1 Tax=Leclercia sp. EC_58 TaxID=2584090 RepID=UPI001C6FDDCE|nr:hypothetical protein [Leclercia sp. EC_58]MBW9398347.1 hypothetical protein [Leclercia sp. EC_58]